METPPAPYAAVEIILSACLFAPATHFGTEHVHLALRIGDAWWVATDLVRLDQRAREEGQLLIDELRVQAAPPGEAPRIIARLRVAGDAAGRQGLSDWDERWLVIAGMGKSARPSATLPILTARTYVETDYDGTVRKKTDARVDVTLLEDGRIHLFAARPLDPKMNPELLGRRLLRFP